MLAPSVSCQACGVAASVQVEPFQIESDTFVAIGIDDVTPQMILPADPLRVRALIVTDAAGVFFLYKDNTVSALNGYVLAFGYSALFPFETTTTGELWAINASGPGVENATRAYIERRIP